MVGCLHAHYRLVFNTGRQHVRDARAPGARILQAVACTRVSQVQHDVRRRRIQSIAGPTRGEGGPAGSSQLRFDRWDPPFSVARTCTCAMLSVQVAPLPCARNARACASSSRRFCPAAPLRLRIPALLLPPPWSAALPHVPVPRAMVEDVCDEREGVVGHGGTGRCAVADLAGDAVRRPLRDCGRPSRA